MLMVMTIVKMNIHLKKKDQKVIQRSIRLLLLPVVQRSPLHNNIQHLIDEKYSVQI
ncbi:unnamed protein product [Trichobilharzia regenti]|nr:unnamed protein product [Trichobilharzia regenti]